ncbi:rhodanese-like domain-containing protein [Hugenholtzia roseola]|uniref:rhodanese-like domain-containing protein n=1 Tax=Hugenholtzia roseola TaxID=1002 RepID=UPI0004087AB0|nr:rhodanese-like domain-containing protein [Hugenholtzia roseola]
MQKQNFWTGFQTPALYRSLVLGLMFSLVVHLGACQKAPQSVTTETATQKGTKEILTTPDFEQKLAATPQAQLVDVRTPAEFASGHLKNAVNIDVSSSDFKEKVANLDKSKPIFVYCRSGARSGMASGILQELGFTQIYDLRNGIVAWQGAGKAVE